MAATDPDDTVFRDGFEAAAPSELQLSEQQPAAGMRVSAAAALRIGAHFEVAGETPDSAPSLSLDGAVVDAIVPAGTTDISVESPPLQAGTHVAVVRLGDLSAQWQFETVEVPRVRNFGPDGAHFPAGSRPEISADFEDAGGLDAASVRLSVNDVDVTTAATVQFDSPQSGHIRYTPSQAPDVGVQVAQLVVGNHDGAAVQALAAHYVDLPAAYELAIDPLSAPASVTSPQLQVRVAASSNVADVESVDIDGVDAAPLDFSVDELVYRADLTLQPGPNALVATAHFSDGATRSASVVVQYDAPPGVIITSPQDWQAFGPVAGDGTPVAGGATDLTGAVERPVTVRGRVSKPGTRVTVNQQLAQLDADGLGFSLDRFFLHEGTNLIGATATDLSGRAGTAQITVFVDQTAPLLSIESPAPQSVTSASRLDVRGVANDAVEPGLNAPEPQVVVRNAEAGTAVTAQVEDRYYVARDVPLQIGANSLVVTATDAAGNARSRQVQVVRVAAGSARVTAIGGDRQSAPVGSALSRALQVALIAADGSPLADRPVHFDVTRGSGVVAAAAGPGAATTRNLLLRTDAQGQAQAWLTLGSEAQQAGNTVRAWSDGIAEDVVFAATGTRGTARWVIVDGTSGYQFAPVGGQPVDALTAIVFDAQRNPLAGVPVVYMVDAGDARFSAQSAPDATVGEDGLSITVETDKNGRAAVRPWLGAAPGTVRIRAQAVSEDGARVGAAVFQIGVRERTDGPTGFAGIVLDHTGAPVPGVRLSVARTSLSSVSDGQGRFQFDDQVPPGKIDVYVDGRDVQITRNGQPLQYPALHFETAVVQGQLNELPHPIYLPPINLAAARVVGGDADVSLTIPGVEGFEMIVKAHSATFPDGSHEGLVVVTPVNSDRLPMVPPGGTGKFGAVAWTIQPTGTRFDPPIEVKLPNSQGMKPRETAPIVQWDHDLAAFVPMGRGTVSEDGTQLVTDQGSGISKAGWGGCVDCPQPPPTCGTNPPPQVCPASADGTRADCGICPSCLKPDPQQCLNACIPDAAQNDRRCEANSCKRCDNAGHCKQKYDETKPPQKTQITYKLSPPVFMPLTDALAHFAGYKYSDLTPATWKFEITPYCTKEGKWKFVLSRAEVLPVIARDNHQQVAEMTDEVIDGITATSEPGYCPLYKAAEFSLRWTASSHYPGGPAQNPAISALIAQHWGGFPGGGRYQRWEGVYAHELYHFYRFKNYMKAAWPRFKATIANLEASMDSCPTPARAKECVQVEFDNAIIQLNNDASTEEDSVGGDGDHDPPDKFYNCHVNALSGVFGKINGLRQAHSCPTFEPVPLDCPQ